MTSEHSRSTERYGWSYRSTELLGAALLRLEVARELARVRLQQADQATLEQWKTLENTVEHRLDSYERRLAEAGELGVAATVYEIRCLELEVCEFIPVPREPSADVRRVIAPLCRPDVRP